jgi:PAS domain S-box-containing protein
MPADTGTGAAQLLSDWGVRAGAFLIIGLAMTWIVSKLREAETKYRTLVEQLPAIVYTAEFGSDGTWRYVSPRIESILGFSPEEWGADRELWFRQLHPEDRDRALAEEGRSKDTGEPLRSEYRLFTRAGRILWFRDEAVVVADNAGHPLFLQGVMYDITERRRADEEVRRLNADLERRVIERTAQLEAASQAKSEFLSKMSHEMRTPLNAVLGFGQVLETENLDPDQLDSVRQILTGGRHLLDLIDELLDIARIESGRISLALEPVGVTDALHDGLRNRIATHVSFPFPFFDATVRGVFPRGYGATLSIGQLVLQVFNSAGYVSGVGDVLEESRRFTLPIWPTVPRRLSWPPRYSVDDQGLDALSFPTGKAP